MRTRRLCLVLALALSPWAAGVWAAGPGGTAGQNPGAVSTLEAVARRSQVQAEALAARDRSRLVPPVSRRVAGKADPLELTPGELVSAAVALQAVLQIIPRDDGSARVNDSVLEESFVARGIDHDPDLGLVAIAAISQVLLFAPETGEVTVLTSPGEDEAFAYANDVLFDGRGNLIIADQGATLGALEPRDGRLWQYSVADGSFKRVAEKREMSDPKFLALDSKSRIVVLDGNAGPLISPLLDLRYDRVLRIKGAKRRGAKKVYVEAGIIATAMSVDPEDRIWLGALSELQLLEGRSLSTPCLVPGPFVFLHDLAIPSKGDAFALDGVASRGDVRKLYEVSQRCRVIEVRSGTRLDTARGVALVREPTASPEE